MEFGKLSDISNVDWTLPPDDPKQEVVLKRSKDNFNLYVGSPAWGNKHFLGKIYPPKTRSEEFLAFYSQYYNSIELNSSYYRIPEKEAVKSWCKQVDKEFRFCPKVYQEISHSRQGLFDQNLHMSWYRFLEDLDCNLGPCFIQFHEMFSYSDKNFLFRFLENWPQHFKIAVELRHPSWFEDHKIKPALVDYLHSKGMGLVITDVAGRRDVLHSSVSDKFSMLRLIGNALDSSDEKRLDAWIKRIKSWKEKGLCEFYLFLHQPDDILTFEFSELAAKLISQNEIEHLKLKTPHFTDQKSLFGEEV